MTKISLTSITLLTFLSLILSSHAFGFTNNFNVTADEELITVSANPGKTYNIELNLNTMSTTQTVYLFGLSLPSDSSYSATTWITPNSSSITLNNQSTTKAQYTLTIPNDISTGEYYQALAVGDKTFSDTESTNPTTFLAIPLTIQVSPNTTESVTTTTSSSSSSSSSSQNQTTTQTPQTTTQPRTTKRVITKKPPTKTPPTNNLFSKLNILNFSANYSPLIPSTTFTIKVKNDGNIYSIPSGSVQIQNLSKNVIKNLPLNPKKNLLKPNSETVYQVTLEDSKYLVGFFKANLKLISSDNQSEETKEINQSISFFYAGQLPLILLILIIYFYLNRKKKYHKYLLIICLGLLVVLIKNSQQQSPKFLSQTQELSISAELKPQIGLKAIINNDLSKTILFTNTNSKGASLYSLRNGVRTNLDNVEQYTFGSYTINLSYPQDSFPIMMLPTGH